MMKQKEEILYAIKEVIAQVMPTGARVVLLGSQVRNDAREDSDWDILILLDKEKLEEAAAVPGASSHPGSRAARPAGIPPARAPWPAPAPRAGVDRRKARADGG